MSVAAVATAPMGAPELSELSELREIREARQIRDADPAERAAARPDLAGSFAHALSEARTREHDATAAAERFAAGDPGMGIHEVMIASEKATLAVRYATTLKNKAVEAYRELMNTQV